MKVELTKNAPDFLVVGAAKSGTTSLWYYLNQHPSVFLNTNPKELGYFSDYYGVNDIDEYLKFFDEAGEKQLVGEVCHAYLSSPECAERIFHFNPNMKIIMILRNPCDRAYSLYNWMVQEGFEKSNSFEKALILEKERLKGSGFKYNSFYFRNYLYSYSGLYFKQVELYLKLFPNNCKIYLFEDFVQDPLQVLTDIADYLGVDRFGGFNLEAQNVSGNVKIPFLNYVLKNHYYSICDKYYIPRRIARYWLNHFNNFNKSKEKVKGINPSTREKLNEFYKNDIKNLSLLINKDLNVWLRS